MTDTTALTPADRDMPQEEVPRPLPPGPDAARAALVAEYTAEWERQVEWRIHIRRYADVMLRQAEGSPCDSGTSGWLSRAGVPALDQTPDGYRRIGDEDRARRTARLALGSSDPVTLDGMPASRIPQRLEALRRSGATWRSTFMAELRVAADAYPRIRPRMVAELDGLLRAPAAPAPASVPASAPAQGAPFPDVVLPLLPAVADPLSESVLVTAVIAVPLRVTGPAARLTDRDLRQQVAERLRGTLQRSVARTPDVRLDEAGIAATVTLDRR